MDVFFADFLERLQTLDRDFIAAFDGLPDEALDWVPGADMNSFVVLVVHVTGATRFWIGTALGEPPERDRAAEFRARGLSAADLKARFAALEADVRRQLEPVSLADLALDRSFTNSEGQRREITAGWALLHALEHLGLHLGHAQITRQLWEQRSDHAGA